MSTQETEVKFYIRDRPRLEARLLGLGARLVHPRVHEMNLRFDLPDGSLRDGGRVLRLRHTDEARLTYKGRANLVDGVMSRTELEFTVGDFESARKLLEALGYIQVAVYEKYRATYELQTSKASGDFGGLVHIMLDELPYGDFAEIEGPDADSIHLTAARLGLDWETAIPASYLMLFERLSARMHLDPARLTFDALNGLNPSAEWMNVRPADGE